MKKIYMLLFISLVGIQLKAQLISWDFNGNAGSEMVVSPTSADPNLSASQISRGVIIATALANTYAATNWTQKPDLPSAIDNSSYYQFTAKANTGFQTSFTQLNANFKRTSTGPRSFQWMYSLDGTNFTVLGSQTAYTGTENSGVAQTPIDLSVIPALQNVNNTTTVTFRLYGFDAVDGAGSFAFGRLGGDDINVSGKVFPSLLLAIRLNDFTVVNNNNVTRLHWLVNCTSSSVKFEMQRAASDRNFSAIYNSTETQARCAQPFDITDDNTPQGANFYRLKILDNNGQVTYSNTLYVNNKNAGNTEIKVFPNITNSNANVSIPADKNYTASIIIIDNQGRQVSKTEASLYKGTNNVAINVSELAPGKYYIKVIGGTEKNNTVVLIKQ